MSPVYVLDVVVGVHSRPDCLTLFFRGQQRNKSADSPLGKHTTYILLLLQSVRGNFYALLSPSSTLGKNSWLFDLVCVFLRQLPLCRSSARGGEVACHRRLYVVLCSMRRMGARHCFLANSSQSGGEARCVCHMCGARDSSPSHVSIAICDTPRQGCFLRRRLCTSYYYY